MGVVDDLKLELGAAKAARLGYEDDWRAYVSYAAPDMERGFNTSAGVVLSGVDAMKKSAARQRSRKLYDGTAVWLLDRLTSAIESLTMPKGFMWHGLKYADPLSPEPSQQDEEYFDTLRDHIFNVRYSDRSGFALANRSCLASTIKLGTGVNYIEANTADLSSIRTPIFYRYIPLYEVYLIVDAQGNDVGFFRERSLEAWQIAKDYGDKVSKKVKDDANDPQRRSNKHTIVQSCLLREGGYEGAPDIRKSRFETVHFEAETKHICKSSGYFQYPLVVRRWDRDGTSPYGSPAQAKVMSDIRSLNALQKEDLIAAGNANRPPLATHKVEKPLNLNSGRINPGLIDEQGRPLYRSMIDTINPGANAQKIEASQEGLRVSLYGDLWQTLLDGNGRTATETRVRAQEKADMIGPFTTNIQAGNPVMFDREFDIIGRRGAFEEGSPLAPPPNIEGEITVSSTSPIDQMREAGNYEGLAAFKEYQTGAAATNPDAADWLDPEEERKLAQRSLGLPAKILRTPEELEELRQQRAEQQAQQEQLAAGESMARMAKDGAPMAQLMAEQGGGNAA